MTKPKIEPSTNQDVNSKKPKIKPLTNQDVNKKLPEQTAELFEVVNYPLNKFSTRIVFHKYGEVDFSKLSIARAHQLVKMEFPYLRPKKQTK